MFLIPPQFYRVVPLSSQFGKAHFWPLIYHLSAVTDDVDSAAEYSKLALCFFLRNETNLFLFRGELFKMWCIVANQNIVRTQNVNIF